MCDIGRQAHNLEVVGSNPTPATKRLMALSSLPFIVIVSTVLGNGLFVLPMAQACAGISLQTAPR